MSACLLAISLALAAGDKQPAPALPREWHGTWAGTLVITPATGTPSEVAISLRVAPIEGSRSLTWAITYGKGEKASVRDYRLVPDGDHGGRFKIDEGNGVLLDARLTGTVLYSQFEVGGALLTARYELRGDTLRFEIVSAKPAAAKTGNGQVQGYVVNVVQSAELKKK